MKDRINEGNGKNMSGLLENVQPAVKKETEEGRDDHRSRSDPDVDPVCDTSFHNAG